MNGLGPDGMWDEEDGFYYDVLRLPDGRSTRLKVRSIVGLLPICAVTVIEPPAAGTASELVRTFMERLRRMPDLLDTIHRDRARPLAWRPRHHGPCEPGPAAQDPVRMLDEDEFLSPYGIRALSRHHAEHPFVFFAQGQEYRVNYLPGGVGHRHVRRQLQLARADLDAGQRADDSRAAAVLFILRGRLSRSNVQPAPAI